MTHEQYWGDSMTPNLFLKYANAYARKRQSDIELMDTMNHQLGRYIAHAFHAPSKYPKDPAYKRPEQSNTNVFKSDEDYERIARIKYGKKE